MNDRWWGMFFLAIASGIAVGMDGQTGWTLGLTGVAGLYGAFLLMRHLDGKHIER